MLTYREISEILKMVDSSDCEEFILELEGIKLVIRRGASGNPGTTYYSSSTGSEAASVVSTAGRTALPQSATAAATPGNTPSPDDNTQSHSADQQLHSPMVGTFYRRPAPDKDAFVDVGDRVEPGTPLCLIEVMKLFTTIESTVSGSIKEIHACDGELVEYDQLLFVFEAN